MLRQVTDLPLEAYCTTIETQVEAVFNDAFPVEFIGGNWPTSSSANSGFQIAFSSSHGIDDKETESEKESSGDEESQSRVCFDKDLESQM